MIRVKAPISGWHEVTYEEARRWAASRLKGMTGRNPLKIINSRIEGACFTEEELLDELNYRQQPGHSQGA